MTGKEFDASEILTDIEWTNLSKSEAKWRCELKKGLRKKNIYHLPNLKTEVLKRLLKESE